MSSAVRSSSVLGIRSVRVALPTFVAAFAGFLLFAGVTQPSTAPTDWLGLALIMSAAIAAIGIFSRRQRGERRVLTAVLDNMVEAIAVHDADTRLLAWNQRYAQLFDMPAALLHARPRMADIVRHQLRNGEFPDLTGDDLDALVEARMAQVPSSATAYSFVRCRPDGSWIEVRSVPLPSGGFVMTYVDVSERKRSEEAMAEQAAQLGTLMENIDQGLVILDAADRMVAFNRRYAELLDLPEPFLDSRPTLGQVSEMMRARGEFQGQSLPDDIAAPDWHGLLTQHATFGLPPVYRRRRPNGTILEFRNTPLPAGGSVRTVYDVTERMRAEESLRASERMLHAVIDAMPIMVNLKDRDRRYLMVNKTTSDLLGIQARELLGRTVWPGRPEDNLSLTATRDIHAIASGESQTYREEAGIDPEGRPRHWITSKTPIKNEQGEVTHVVTASYDVSELVRADAAARESERMLHSILDAIPIAVVVKGRDRRYMMMNRATADMFKVTPEQVIGKDSWPGRTVDEQAAATGRDTRAIETGETLLYQEKTGRDDQGRPLFWMTAKTAIRDDDGRVTHVVSASYDISERKRAEDAVRTSQQMLKAVLDAIPISVNVKDRDLRYVMVNRHLAEITGFDAERIIGMNTNENPANRHRDVTSTLDRQVLETGKPVFFFEETIVDVQGRDRSWRTTKVPIVDEAGKVTHIVTAGYDVSDLKAAEQQVRDSERRIRDLLESSPIGVAVTRRDGTLKFWNARYAEYVRRLTDQPIETVDVRNFYRHAAVRDAVAEQLRRDGKVPDIEIECETPSGAPLWVSSTLERVDFEGERATLGWFYEVTELKEAERRVRDSEHRLRAILESSPIAVSITRVDGTRLFSNKSIATLYGRPQGELSTTSAVASYVDPEDRTRMIAQLQREGRVSGAEVALRRADGSIFWVLSFWQSIEIDGEICIVAWLIDQTERKMQGQELARQSALLQTTLENMDQAIAMFDNTMTLLAWNRRFQERSLLPDEFFEGDRTYAEMVRTLGPTEYGLHTQEEIDRYVEAHAVFLKSLTAPHSSTHERPDGRILDIRTVPMPDGGFVRTYTDVTELQQAQRQLRENETRLRTLLESSPLAVSLQTFAGKRLFVNQAYSDLYGLTEEEARSENPRSFYVDPGERGRLLERLKAEDRIPGIEIEFVGQGGRRFWAYMLWQRLTVDGEDSFVTWAYDVTERRRYQEELTQARDLAEQANRAKSSFLATMSHEIRTPMNGVLGLLELLQQSPLTAEQQEMATVIGESASSLLKIIDDILDFSKIEAGKLDVEQVPVTLLPLVEGIAETLAAAARKKSLALVSFVDPALPDLVRGDPVRLRQILFNLIGNAIKFTERGQVAIEVAPDLTQDWVQFRIVDTGIGLTPEAIERLFQPFVQADGSTTRKFGGTGLGLSISKRLIERMGGEIGVESTLGQGSVFKVRLPLPAEPAKAIAHRALDGIAMLVVEDDPTMRSVLLRYLGVEGARVEWTASGEAALERLRAPGLPRIDAVVTDYKLPGMDGFTLRHALSQDPALSEIGTVLLTAYDDRGQRRRALEAGFRAYLTKPVRRAVLLRAVDIALGRAGAEDHATEELAPEPGAPVDRAQALAEGRLILVAEDNPTNQMLIRRQLERLGYAADIVADGRQGIDTYASVHYGLVVSDCHMPVMDGFELTQKIRDLEHLTGRPRVPIVALTANVLQGEAERCLAAGMDDYLGKPVRLARLAETIQRWLPKSGATGAPQAGGRSAAKAAAAEGLALDLAHLLEMFGEIDEVARDTLATFLASTDELVGTLAARLAAGDVEAAGKAAHSIKGAARSAGAFPLAEIASGIEAATKDKAIDTARDLAEGLAPELARVAAEVRRI